MGITTISQSGFKWAIRAGKGYQDDRVIFEVVGSDQYHLRELAEHIQPKVILDVGGHIGTFGVWAKSFWPKAKVIAVEPDFENYTLYQKNVELNGLEDVEIINMAVSYEPTATCLVHSPSTTGGYVLRTTEEARDYIRRQYRYYNYISDYVVPLITVEELTEGIDIIDLAKWDCEGGEVDAFKNMDDETAAKFRFMVGEYHIWSEKSDYLRPSLFECFEFWRTVRRKFPHLGFNCSESKPLGNFQAWPKGGV